MSDDKLQPRTNSPLKERGQYLLAFGVVASMLWVANFPIFVIFFFGVFAYFLLRMFAAGSRSETREIFEFYLTEDCSLIDMWTPRDYLIQNMNVRGDGEFFKLGDRFFSVFDISRRNAHQDNAVAF